MIIKKNKRRGALESVEIFIRHFFILIGIVFVYGFIYSMMPKEEFGFKDDLDPYYFSFTTLSTVGYGDLSPKSKRAKILTITQQILTLVDLRIFLLG